MNEVEEKDAVEKIVAGVQGAREEVYKEPPCPPQYQGEEKVEYLQKTLSPEEFGKFIAHKLLQPIYTQREEKENE